MKPTSANSLSAKVRQWWERHDRGGAKVILLLACILVAALAWLIWGDDPWKRQWPQKFLAGEKVDTRSGIVLGLWAAAFINAVIATVLLATSRWWARRRDPVPRISHPPLPLWSRRLFLWGLVAAMPVAIWIRVPRLSHSFWNDEEQVFRAFIWGENVVTESGELEFHQPDWKHTMFVTKSGNNHVINTMGARALHEIWKKFFFREGDRPFRESVIRLEPFINGLLGIAALALLLRVAGFPVAGVTAAWILTLNPWHVRYSVEARGYADLMLFIALTFICLTLALRSGKWRWWLGFGLFQSLYFLSFFGAMYLAVPLNLIILMLIIKRRSVVQFWRWFVGTIIGAMAFIQIVIPMSFKIFEYIEGHTNATFPITAAHLQDFWAHLVLGTQWKTMADPSLHHGISVEMYQASHPIIFVLMVFIIPVIVIIGTLGIIIKGRELWILVCAMLGAIILVGLHSRISDMTFYIWYGIYVILGFAAVVAFVPELITAGWQNLNRNRQKTGSASLPIFAVAMLVALVAGYGWMVAPSLMRVRSFERQAMRDAVEFVRNEAPALNADNAKILTYAIGSGNVQMLTYDPWVHPVRKQEDFDEMMKKARETKEPMFVYVCSPTRVQREYPQSWKLLEDEQLFEKVKYVKSLEEFWSFQIYRLKNKSS